jgi:hypothetical protein
VAPPSLLDAAGGRFRIFSVDGNHEAGPMAGDLALAARTVAEGGLVIVDDYFNERWPGVSEGTLRYLWSDEGRGSRLVPFAIFSTKVFLTHATWADGYLAHLRAGAGDYAVVETPFLGRSVGTVRFPPPATLSMRLADTPLWRALRGTVVGTAVRRIRSAGR